MKLQRKPTHSSSSSSSTPRTSSSSLDAKGNVTLLASSRRKFFRQDNFIFANQCKSLGQLRKYKILLLLIIVCVCLLILYANSETLVQKPLLDFLLSDALETDGTTSSTISSSSTGDLDNFESPLSGNKLKNHHHHHKEVHYTLPLKLRHSNITRQGILTYDGVNSKTDFNLFVIYTKENYQLHMKFELFVKSLLKHSTARIHLHIITDNNSKGSAEEIIHQQLRHYHRSLIYSFYDINACAERVTDIVKAMRPHFSSTPRSYYSDTLFFLSLGLHRIADKTMDRAILLDCDIVFRSDVRHLFSEFEHFHEENLFGLAPELTPVYRHILYRYRANNPNTNFGTPYYPIGSVNRYMESNSNEEKFKILRAHRNNNNNINNNNNNNNIHHGYPGLNSGVVLLYLSRIRSSDFYEETLKAGNVKALTTKYSFKGHLGDQDFYTLLGYEYPSLIYHLDCIWNRQLCTWWKDHGYSNIFDAYFHCEGKIKMYHGNCNTRVPE